VKVSRAGAIIMGLSVLLGAPWFFVALSGVLPDYEPVLFFDLIAIQAIGLGVVIYNIFERKN